MNTFIEPLLCAILLGIKNMVVRNIDILHVCLELQGREVIYPSGFLVETSL